MLIPAPVPAWDSKKKKKSLWVDGKRVPYACCCPRLSVPSDAPSAQNVYPLAPMYLLIAAVPSFWLSFCFASGVEGGLFVLG